MEKSIELVNYSKSCDSCLQFNWIEIISVVDRPVVPGTLEMHIMRWFLLQGDFDLSRF